MSPRKNFVVHSEKEICGIRKAAQAAATVKNNLASMIRAGITTKNIDDMAAAMISAEGGKSAFLGYRGFPCQICISVNDEVVHGIASPVRRIFEGDIVSIDVGVNVDGYIGDNAMSVYVGSSSPPENITRLLEGTEASLQNALKAVLPGNDIGNVSIAVEKVARRHNLSVVREYVGHGCGVELHEPPEIPNYRTRNRGPKLRPGMVLAIEPMLNLGGRKVITDKDGWTVRTKDGSLSAHFEHMALVTESKPEILTWQKM